MSHPAASDGNPPTKRYRLPGIEREGIAQLSLIETALCPLKGGKLETSRYETSYLYTVDGSKRSARVSVYAPLGLQTIDEFILWGLLGISLDRPNPEPTLLATPYWIINRLGMSIGGFAYDQLRASLERLALVGYQNTGFYNPLRSSTNVRRFTSSRASFPRAATERTLQPIACGASSGTVTSFKCVRRRAVPFCLIWNCSAS